MNAAGGDHHRHDGQPVQSVGEVNGVCGAAITKPPTKMKNSPSGSNMDLKNGSASTPLLRGVFDLHDEPGRQKGDAELDHQPQPPLMPSEDRLVTFR